MSNSKKSQNFKKKEKEGLYLTKKYLTILVGKKPPRKIGKRPTTPTKDIYSYLKGVTQKELKKILGEIKNGKKGRTNYNYLQKRIRDLVARQTITPEIGKKLIEQIRKKAS